MNNFSTKTLSCKSFAKINLYFEILNNQNIEKNSKHHVKTVLFALDLFDEVKLTLENKSEKLTSIEPICHIKMIGLSPENTILEKENLAYKAVQIFFKGIPSNYAVDIEIKKNIPLAGGLAGGSSNAAAVLYLLNQILEVYNEDELYEIAGNLGADIPFSLLTIINKYKHEQQAVVALGTNFGEKVELVEVNQDFCQKLQNSITLKTFDYGISTKESYAKYDQLKLANGLKQTENSKSTITNLIEGLKNGDKNKVFNNIYNSLEEVALIFRPELQKYLEYPLEYHCERSFISGSGPTIVQINMKEGKDV